MLCVFILYISSRTYNLKSTPNDRFFEKVFKTILFTPRVFARNLLRGNRRKINFCILFWCLAWGSNPGLRLFHTVVLFSDKPCHYRDTTPYIRKNALELVLYNRVLWEQPRQPNILTESQKIAYVLSRTLLFHHFIKLFTLSIAVVSEITCKTLTAWSWLLSEESALLLRTYSDLSSNISLPQLSMSFAPMQSFGVISSKRACVFWILSLQSWFVCNKCHHRCRIVVLEFQMDNFNQDFFALWYLNPSLFQ